MPYPGLILAVFALLLAADGLADPAKTPERPSAAEPKCRFTLERGAAPAEDAAETWVLTCHRAAEPAAPADAVALRRVEPAPAEVPVGF